MRNLVGLKIETKLSLVILAIFVAIFLVAVFSSMDDFNKLIKRMDQYEELRIK